jgi:hypothetical protein
LGISNETSDLDKSKRALIDSHGELELPWRDK